MPTVNTLALAIFVIPLTAALGCSSSSANDHSPSQSDDGAASTQVDASASSSPTGQRNPLGMACSSNDACASGFCTDGVCCDSACVGTCYACDLASALGHCAALTTGVDPNASSPCAAPSACVLPNSSRIPACKLVDGTACQIDGDCVSGHCLTYYVDADGDGYGTSEEAHFCAELNGRPPAGYAAYGGDCCDLDTGANPGFDSSLFLQMPDACGSFDWNCDGRVEQEKSCPSAVACGAACVANFGFVSVTLFSAACH